MLIVILIAAPFVVPPLVVRFIERELADYGVAAKASMSMRYCWRNGPGVAGELTVVVPDTPWTVRAQFGASCCEWSAHVKLPKTAFSERDPLVRQLLARYPLEGASDLSFSGTLAVDAGVERTFHKPMPVWSARAEIKDVAAQFVSEDEDAFAVAGLAVTPGASGIGEHIDIAPMFLRARSVSVGELALTNLHATVRATEKSLMVNEASAGFCGGRVNVYSLHLNASNLNTGFTLFLEDVDAGEVLAQFQGFEGEASGRLHGKVRAFVREGGKAIRLRDAFLYSTPGETGKLKMSNPEVVTENLAYAGLDDRARANVTDALGDLDYKVLRMDLKRTDKNNACLSVQIGGTATRGGTTVPVDLTINFNGPLEQLINTGLGCSNKLKGNKK